MNDKVFEANTSKIKKLREESEFNEQAWNTYVKPNADETNLAIMRNIKPYKMSALLDR